MNVPNLTDALYPQQAEPDAGDFASLGARQTGVISGGGVTATGSGLGLSVAAVSGVIDGVPFSKGTTTALTPNSAPSSGSRYDLVVFPKSGSIPTIIEGTAASRPVFPAFDPTQYAFLAAVQINAGVVTLPVGAVVDKRSYIEAGLVRPATASTEVVAITDTATSKTFKVKGDGEHRWVSSILRRTADATMEWATSLTMLAADSVIDPLLALKARASNAAAQRLVQFLNSAGTEIGYVNGLGQAYFSNFKFGTGSPEGAVVGAKGDIYVDRSAATQNDMLWLKSTASGNTGWFSLKAYNPAEQVIPTGVILAYPGTNLPSGFIWANGNYYDPANPVYAPLFNEYGYTWGQSGTLFRAPYFNGRMQIGTGTVNGVTIAVGTMAGIANASVTLTEDELPTHDHDVDDPGHKHPRAGKPWYYRPPAEHNNQHPYPSTSISLPHLYTDDTDPTAQTGITVLPAGGGGSFSVLNPVVGMTYIVKL